MVVVVLANIHKISEAVESFPEVHQRLFPPIISLLRSATAKEVSVPSIHPPPVTPIKAVPRSDPRTAVRRNLPIVVTNIATRAWQNGETRNLRALRITRKLVPNMIGILSKPIIIIIIKTQLRMRVLMLRVTKKMKIKRASERSWIQ
jgi:hypothetical protein